MQEKFLSAKNTQNGKSKVGIWILINIRAAFASQKQAIRGSAIAPAASRASLSPVAASRPYYPCHVLQLLHQTTQLKF